MTVAKIELGMKAPAYQEYAANMLADIDFRSLDLAARGLLYTLRLECWVNVRMPSCPALLAKVLGLPENEVARGLKGLSPFFNDDAGMLYCKSLEGYRAAQSERRARQSAGGKKGAETTNKKWTPSDAPRPGTKPVPTQSAELINDPWVHEYEKVSGSF